jgi:methionyl-tRNA formyltransferase
LRVVVVARPSAANQYVLGDLARVCQVQALLTGVSAPRPRRNARRIGQELRSAPVATVTRPGRRVILRRLESRLDRQIAAHLEHREASMLPVARAITAMDLNGDIGAAVLREAQPDLMILSGAPLLKPRTYSIPRLGTVNLHWGIAPEYRGQQSIFTALRRRDYTAIGVTLHYVDSGVDTGPILAQGWPSLEPADTLASIWAKTASLASTMLTEFVQRAQVGPVPGHTRQGAGVVVRTRDRRVWHHADYGIQRILLHRHPTPTQGRITRYWP